MNSSDVSNADLIRVFVDSQDLLYANTRDNRLHLNPLTIQDLNTIAGLCFAVEAIADADRKNPTAPALRHLALTTAALLTTAAVIAPDNPRIYWAWRRAWRDYQGACAWAAT